MTPNNPRLARIRDQFHATAADRKHHQVMKLMDKLRQMADAAVRVVENPDVMDGFQGTYNITLDIIKAHSKTAKKSKG